jgi:hypothetical protein
VAIEKVDRLLRESETSCDFGGEAPTGSTLDEERPLKVTEVTFDPALRLR